MFYGWQFFKLSCRSILIFQQFMKGMNVEYQETVIVFTIAVFSLIVWVNFENSFHFLKSNYDLLFGFLEEEGTGEDSKINVTQGLAGWQSFDFKEEISYLSLWMGYWVACKYLYSYMQK